MSLHPIFSLYRMVLTISTSGDLDGKPRFGKDICGVISISIVSLSSTMYIMDCFNILDVVTQILATLL